MFTEEQTDESGFQAYMARAAGDRMWNQKNAVTTALSADPNLGPEPYQLEDQGNVAKWTNGSITVSVEYEPQDEDNDYPYLVEMNVEDGESVNGKMNAVKAILLNPESGVPTGARRRRRRGTRKSRKSRKSRKTAKRSFRA
jgi:hypothetical protein